MEVKTFEFVNLDYLNLMADGDNNMKKIMLEMLFEELPTEISKMRQLQQVGDWEEMKSVAHKMKSTLAFIGNETLSAANIEIENITKANGDTTNVDNLLNIIEDMYPKAIAELKTEYNRL